MSISSSDPATLNTVLRMCLAFCDHILPHFLSFLVASPWPPLGPCTFGLVSFVSGAESPGAALSRLWLRNPATSLNPACMWMTPSSRCLHFMSCLASPLGSLTVIQLQPVEMECLLLPPNSFLVLLSRLRRGDWASSPHDRHVEPPLSPILSCSHPSVHQGSNPVESSTVSLCVYHPHPGSHHYCLSLVFSSFCRRLV